MDPESGVLSSNSVCVGLKLFYIGFPVFPASAYGTKHRGEQKLQTWQHEPANPKVRQCSNLSMILDQPITKRRTQCTVRMQSQTWIPPEWALQLVENQFHFLPLIPSHIYQYILSNFFFLFAVLLRKWKYFDLVLPIKREVAWGLSVF